MPKHTLVDAGSLAILRAFFNNIFPAGTKNLTLKLFTNDLLPGRDDITADYTEAAGGGYASKTLTNGSWVESNTDPPYVSYAEQTWTFTGGLTGNQTVYGYYVVNDNGVLILAGRLGEPQVINEANDEIKLTPKFELSWGIPT